MEQLLKRAEEADSAQSGPKVVRLPLIEFANQVGLLFTRNTQFDGKFQLNALPNPDFVNLYILDADPEGIAKHFRKNCEYIGYFNTVICDAALFRYYFSTIEAIQRTYDITFVDRVSKKVIPIEGEPLDDVKKLIKQSLVVWILGHEIGHAVLHKEVLLRDNVRLHFDLEYSSYEQEADSFVAKGLINDSPLAASYSVAGGEFVHQEFRRLYREQAHKDDRGLLQIDSRDFVLKNKLAIPYSRYNVPVLLRALRIINKMLDAAPELDNTGFFAQVESNVTPVMKSPDRYSFWVLFAIAGLLGCAVLAWLLWSGTDKGGMPHVDPG